MPIYALAATLRELRRFERGNGKVPFDDFMDTLEGKPAYEEIMLKLDKVERGNLGDARSVGEGVTELEVDLARVIAFTSA